VGGAKETKKYRPWRPICVIHGFYEESTARRFEYRLQKMFKKNKRKHVIEHMKLLLGYNDGVLSWPHLNIRWFNHNYMIKGYVMSQT
jgi:hypothetical protein